MSLGTIFVWLSVTRKSGSISRYDLDAISIYLSTMSPQPAGGCSRGAVSVLRVVLLAATCALPWPTEALRPGGPGWPSPPSSSSAARGSAR
jgi:hypothetical protein